MARTAHQKLLTLDEPDKLLLRERAKEAAKKQEVDVDADGLEILEIYSRGQNFAFPLSCIASVRELTSIAFVPRVPTAVRGLVSVRGEVLVGVELAFLTGAGGAGIADLRRIIVVAAEELRIAVLAERTASVRSVKASSFRADRTAQSPFITGTDQNFISLVDPAALIRHVFSTVLGGTP